MNKLRFVSLVAFCFLVPAVSGCAGWKTNVSSTCNCYLDKLTIPKDLVTDNQWLAALKERAINGDMEARLNYAGLSNDLMNLLANLSDQAAEERISYIKHHPWDASPVRDAIFQLGHLRRSASARKAMVELATDTGLPGKLRQFSVQWLGTQLGKVDTAPQDIFATRKSTDQERKLVLKFLHSHDPEDRKAAIWCIERGDMLELSKQLRTAYNTENDKDVKAELHSALETNAGRSSETHSK
jgi:hypothetical protein